MEQIKAFLDTSTIHGLSWISSTSQCSRIFWIIVVISGFSFALFLINQSFYNSTTVATLPISQVKFPNVTVCPPKNSFLNLNYDIQQAEKISLTKDSRKELLDYVTDVIQEEFYEEVMKNLAKFVDPDRFYNWYHGMTKIIYPYYSPMKNHLFYTLYTSATSGNFSTQYFREPFNVFKVNGKVSSSLYVYVPYIMKDSSNSTLQFSIEKTTIMEYSDDYVMKFDCFYCYIEPELTHWNKTITGPFDGQYYIEY